MVCTVSISRVSLSCRRKPWEQSNEVGRKSVTQKTAVTRSCREPSRAIKPGPGATRKFKRVDSSTAAISSTCQVSLVNNATCR